MPSDEIGQLQCGQPLMPSKILAAQLNDFYLARQCLIRHEDAIFDHDDIGHDNNYPSCAFRVIHNTIGSSIDARLATCYHDAEKCYDARTYII